jgi:hypothetical protein
MTEISTVINFNRVVKSNLSQHSGVLEKLLVELWRAIEITGNIQSEAEGIDGSEFLHSVAKAERILVEAILELMQTAVIPVDGTSLQGVPSASQGVAPSPCSALPSPSLTLDAQ